MMPARRDLPSLTGHRRVLAAAAVDAFGVGAFYPLSFLFLLQRTDLGAATIGLAVTIGTTLALPFGPLLGALVDRIGPNRPLAAGNLTLAAAYLLFLTADSAATVALTAFLIMFSDRLYWSSWPVYVGTVARKDQLDSWYALVSMLKNGGIGLGALFASLTLALDADATRVLLLCNVATSTLAGVLILTARAPRLPAGREADGSTRAGWRTVLRDRGFMLFCAGFTAVTFGWMLPTVALPAFLVDAHRLPHWLPSVAFAVNCVLVFAGQPAATRALRGFRRTRLISTAAVLFVVSVTLMVAAVHTTGTAAVALALSSALTVTAAELVCGPAANALMAACAPPGTLGRYNAVFQLTWTTSTAAGPAVIAALSADGAALWAGYAVLMALGVTGILAAERHLKPDAVHTAPAGPGPSTPAVVPPASTPPDPAECDRAAPEPSPGTPQESPR